MESTTRKKKKKIIREKRKIYNNMFVEKLIICDI